MERKDLPKRERLPFLFSLGSDYAQQRKRESYSTFYATRKHRGLREERKSKRTRETERVKGKTRSSFKDFCNKANWMAKIVQKMIVSNG
jgi:hypothetical protein